MTILAAVSGERRQDRVVEVAYDLATTDDDVGVLHVTEQAQFEDVRDRGRSIVSAGGSDEDSTAYVSSNRCLPEYNLEEATSDAADVARECVSTTLDDRPGTVSAEGRVGDSATEIVEEGTRLDTRYIVVGGRKRTPTGKAFSGAFPSRSS